MADELNTEVMPVTPSSAEETGIVEQTPSSAVQTPMTPARGGPAHFEWDPLVNARPAWDGTESRDAETYRLEHQKNLSAEAYGTGDMNTAWGRTGIPGFIEMWDTKAVKNLNDRFLSSDWGYGIYRNVERKVEAGPIDPNWKPDAWLDKNNKQIPVDRQWRFRLTNNEAEAKLLLEDMAWNDKTNEMLGLRTGISPFALDLISGAAGVDNIASMGLGGLTATARIGINSTKWGRAIVGAGSGAALNTVGAMGAYYANPSEDWTSIPVAGLMGMSFGALGGVMSKGPRAHDLGEPDLNMHRDAMLNEFGETVAEGNVRAKQVDGIADTTGDNYGFARRQAEKEALAEAAAKSNPETVQAAPVEGAANAARRGPVVVKMDTIEVLDGAADALPTGRLGEAEAMSTEGKATVGARQMGQNGQGISSIESQDVLDVVQDSINYDRTHRISQDYFANTSNLDNLSAPLARAARRFHDVVARIPGLQSDTDRLMKSGTAVGARIVYDFMSSGAGILRNRRSSAGLKLEYERQLGGTMKGYMDDYSAWAKEIHGAGWIKQVWNNDLKAEFDIAVANEIQFRKYGNNDPGSHPAVLRAVERVADHAEMQIDILKGRPGEGSVFGADVLQKDRNYMQQQWNGAKFQKLINERSKGDVIDALTEIYGRHYPNVSLADRTLWSKAMVDRAMREGVTSSNLYSVLQADGRQAVEDLLRRNGATDAQIKRLIDDATNVGQEKGKAGYMKQRIDVDLRSQASNGIALYDLVTTDMTALIDRRTRQVAGSGALARNGIRGREDLDLLIRANLAEQQANGRNTPGGPGAMDKVNDFIDADQPITDQFLRDVFSYYGAGPIGGGVSPTVSRMLKMANLSFLGMLGITQAAEFGPALAAVGWKQFASMLSDDILRSLGKKSSFLADELEHFSIFVPEDRIFRNDLHHEMDRLSSVSELGAAADGMLNKLSRMQGFTSGFYAIRNIQQRMAVSITAEKIFRHLDGSKPMSASRLHDIGLDADLLARMDVYLRNGTVELVDGRLKKLNLDKWSDADVEDFSLSVNQASYNMVQRAMLGESNVLFNKNGIAALFVQMKQFPLVAVQKQMYRNLRHADSTSSMEFLYGMAMAGAVYSSRQLITGKEDNLTAEKIAKGAFGMSNMTGWIPMWVDPLAGLLGINTNLSGYSRPGQGVVGMPAAVSAFNQYSMIPAALINLATGTHDNSSIRALEATPVIGKMVGFNYLLNSLKTARKERGEVDHDPHDKMKKLKKESDKEEFDPVAEAMKKYNEMLN